MGLKGSYFSRIQGTCGFNCTLGTLDSYLENNSMEKKDWVPLSALIEGAVGKSWWCGRLREYFHEHGNVE